MISKATSKKEGHIHRLTSKDLERIHIKDIRNERTTPRSYICIRDIEAFELIIRSNGKNILMMMMMIINGNLSRSNCCQWSSN